MSDRYQPKTGTEITALAQEVVKFVQDRADPMDALRALTSAAIAVHITESCAHLDCFLRVITADYTEALEEYAKYGIVPNPEHGEETLQ